MSLALKNLKCHSAASLGAFLAPQDDQLTSEHCIVCLKPALRLERRGQHGQNKPNQRDHRASLADSVTRKIRIRFSVHTGPRRMPRDAKLDRSFPLAHHAESSLRRSHGGRQSIKLGFQLSSPPLVEMRPIAAPLTSIIGEPDMRRLTPPSN